MSGPEFTLLVECMRGKCLILPGERLVKGAVPHVKRLQDQALHELRKRYAGYVLHQDLKDRIGAPRIALFRPGRSFDHNGLGIFGRRAVQNVDRSGYGFIGAEAGKTVRIKSSRMGQNCTNGHWFFVTVGAFW